MSTPSSATIAKDSLICSVHGDVGDDLGWLPCWAGCHDGYFDAYEDDPITNAPDDLEVCRCCGGKGGWRVCGVCNAHNPDVEW